VSGDRTPYPVSAHTERFTIWALHDKVRRWIKIRTGMAGRDAVAELAVRQDRLRRAGEPCRLIVLEDGQVPQ
jgi:hypothetical protein